jgi:predicted nucleic acid-binding protein
MVVDASVVVSYLVPHDVHHEASRGWITRHVADGGLVIAPAVLLRTGGPRLAQRAIDALLDLPELRLVPVDDGLARTAAILAARLRLRGADAVYVAAASALDLPLVTWDVEQRERSASTIEVRAPEA